MVLDKIVNVQLIQKIPAFAIPIGFIFVLIGFISSALIFPSELSIVIVALSSLLILPYVIKIFEIDELDIDLDEIVDVSELKIQDLEKWVKKCLRDGYTPKQIRDSLIRNNLDKIHTLLYDLGVVDGISEKYTKGLNVVTRHIKLIEFYSFLFLGMFLAYAVLFGILSPEIQKVAFKNQLSIIVGPRGYFNLPESFYGIISNNIKIIFICVALSFLYGAGAVFILNYNASIAGVLYGSSLRKILYGTGFAILSNPLSYVPHTTLEIFAYLLAAISGGILSKVAAKEQPGAQRLLLIDGVVYLILSIIVVLIAGYVEVTVPGMF